MKRRKLLPACCPVGTLSAHKLTEREGRLLKLMSGAMTLGITFAAARLTRAGRDA
jgi:hypothetical protein